MAPTQVDALAVVAQESRLVAQPHRSRLLCLQADTAPRILEMLEGAMGALIVGDPAELATDVGPVISAAAADGLRAHIAAMRRAGARLLKQTALPADAELERLARVSGIAATRFVPPTLLEIDDMIAQARGGGGASGGGTPGARRLR